MTIDRRRVIRDIGILVGGVILSPSSIFAGSEVQIQDRYVADGTAKMKLEIFSDFECPGCKIMSGTVHSLREKYACFLQVPPRCEYMQNYLSDLLPLSG